MSANKLKIIAAGFFVLFFIFFTVKIPAQVDTTKPDTTTFPDTTISPDTIKNPDTLIEPDTLEYPKQSSAGAEYYCEINTFHSISTKAVVFPRRKIY